MSLLLSGAKTIVFAGTEMQCLEIYTGEAYTIGLNFTDAVGTAIDISTWTLGVEAGFYSVDTVIYNDEAGEIQLGNITLSPDPQPSTGAGTYTDDLAVATVSGPAGTGYLYMPSTITGGTGTPVATPIVPLVEGKSTPTILVITTILIDRTDTVSGLVNKTREPLGFIVRYQ
jgi:hypothetical protein|tara:strand:+ start:9867 stop:10382 length:516 start_codon:yes stop_codon:yes gene_type:complete